MEYSKDLLKRIEQMGADMMTPFETSVLLGIDETEFQDEIITKGTAARLAYLRGYLTTVHEMKQNLRDIAGTGSPAAIAQSISFIKDIGQKILI